MHVNAFSRKKIFSLPANILGAVVSGGVFPLDGEPTAKTTAGELSKEPGPFRQPQGGAASTNKESRINCLSCYWKMTKD